MTSVDGVPVRVVLRPIGNPLPLAFLGLFVAALSFSALQLGWIGTSQSHTVALLVLVVSVPAQALSAVFGFLARDPAAGTGTGLQAGAWAALSLATLTSPPGAMSSGVGVVLLAAAGALLVPAVASHAKPLALLVIGLTAARFAVTGVAEITGSSSWLTAAGWVGIALAVVSLYAALAFELEGVDKRRVVPVPRVGAAAAAVSSGAQGDIDHLTQEPGVRATL